MISYEEQDPRLRNMGVLDAGYYLLVTGTRLADGGVLARISSFVLPAQKDEFKPVATKVPYHLRESGEKVAVIGNFNSESLFTPVERIGEKVMPLARQSILQTCGRGYFVVAVLGAGQEPTNHALKDIAALAMTSNSGDAKWSFFFLRKNNTRNLMLPNSRDFRLLLLTVLILMIAFGKELCRL